MQFFCINNKKEQQINGYKDGHENRKIDRRNE